MSHSKSRNAYIMPNLRRMSFLNYFAHPIAHVDPKALFMSNIKKSNIIMFRKDVVLHRASFSYLWGGA